MGKRNESGVGLFGCVVGLIGPTGGLFPWMSGVIGVFFQAEDGIRNVEKSSELGDVYKRK